MSSIKRGLIILFTLFLQAYFLFGRIIFFSLSKLTIIIVPAVIITAIFVVANRKKHKYTISETGISYKKRSVDFDKIRVLAIHKVEIGYNVVLNRLIRKNSLLIPCENREEMEKVKKVILENSTPTKVKQVERRWILQINTVIALILFLFSFTWDTKLEPIEFQYKEYSHTNCSTRNYSFMVEKVEFEDIISPENHYLLTSKGKITFRQYANPKLSVLEYFAYPLNPANMEKERPIFPFIDFYNSHYEGFLIRLIKKNAIIEYSPRLFYSEYFEAVLLNNNGIKELILRKNKASDILYIDFSKEFSDEDILQVLESVKFKS